MKSHILFTLVLFACVVLVVAPPPIPKENRPKIPEILGPVDFLEPIGIQDTILDTIRDPLGQVYNTAVGLIRGLFTQIGGGRAQELVGNALQPLNLNPLNMQPLQPKPQAPAWQTAPQPPPPPQQQPRPGQPQVQAQGARRPPKE
ncbi:uncharacterized protein VTP21DRAFT_3285 [Calcarisporiella thermophila]|uniref:uncharacterized protein n=1 Tax=Calcarisporiella thermophila TaxID=911321 RepID=UPI0037435C05